MKIMITTTTIRTIIIITTMMTYINLFKLNPSPPRGQTSLT